MPYYLAVNYQKLENGKSIAVLKEIRELSYEEISVYDSAIYAVYEYRKFINSVYLLESNYKEFKTFLENPLASTEFIGHDEKINNTLLNANRIFMNLLFSFTATHDHVKEFLNKEERNDFKNITKDTFEKSLHYRFIWKLRNYAQHFNLPLTNLSIDEFMENNEHKSVAKFMISRDELLKYKKWNDVKNDLEKFEEFFEITQFIQEAIDELIAIFNKYRDEKLKNIDIDLLNLSNFIMEVNVFSKENNLSNIYPFICQIDERMQPMMLHFPLKLLVDLDYIKLKNIL